MFDHVKFGVSDYAASKAFYLAALQPLGVTVVTEWPPNGVELSQPTGSVSMCLFQTEEKPAHLHLAFTAATHLQVDAFYRAALQAGGKDNGAPGLRPHYHANYYAAFVIGPDGQNIEAVCHEPLPVLPREFAGGRLRRLRPGDLQAFQTYRALPELGRYQGWSVMPETQALAFLDKMNRAPLFTPGQWVQLGIAESPGDVLVGDIGLHLSNDGATGEVGFTLQPSAQGRGLAGRAVQVALDLLFSATATSQVLGITDARNHPSIRLLERLGFGLVEARELVFRGEPCTEKVYALPRVAG
jgi:RimJ/RimL family protein N-acetyltransferase/catechol 2,3-dioxygenase-like lactoylglutathione lyase family enzyme